MTERRPKRVAILGSTGSIGVNALRVIADMPEHFEVAGLAAHSSVEGLLKQIEAHEPAMAAVFDDKAHKALKGRMNGSRAKVLAPGVEGLCEMAAAK
ncbi:MAG TPA: 1-deoxy-D-xylulose-5-phosphate reductoisomerase, partial [Elusimicrobiota bacterium]|nr:1-deoxy-D-xylulose-5-phosphate reductoisomerase [Elusimicrobiota bacterium]